MSLLRDIVVYLCGLVVLRLCEAQIIRGIGPCPDVEVVSNFDVEKYMGKWYDASRYLNILQIGAKCVIYIYERKKDQNIGVINIQINTLFGGTSEIEGKLNRVTGSEDGKLTVNYPSLPLDITAPYWVVDTDYVKYALVWSCHNFGTFHTQNAWILTREKYPNSSDIDKAVATANKNDISQLYFMQTDQKNCPSEE